FCRPRTGHDKGGVESRGKAIRWQHLVPIPKAASLDEVRATLLARLDAAVDQVRLAAERAQSLALPAHPFDARKTYAAVGVSRRSLVCIEGTTYSVPCVWAGLEIKAHVGSDAVTLVGPSGDATHARGRFGEKVINYTHYIPELAKKPQAVRQVASKLIDDLGPTYAAAWRALVDAHGPKQAARVFAKVLAHVEDRGIDAVAKSLGAALAKSEPLLLALAPPAPPIHVVERDALPAALRDVDVTAGCAADYDVLLPRGAS